MKLATNEYAKVFYMGELADLVKWNGETLEAIKYKD